MEQIYCMLDCDSAVAIVILMVYNKGKTLGQVAVEKSATCNGMWTPMADLTTSCVRRQSF